MRTYIRIVISTLALVSAASPARGQEDRREHASASPALVEVTPFVSLGSVGSSRIGAAIAFAWTSDLSVEAEVGYRQGELNALSSNISLIYDLPRLGRVAPYLAGGVGLEQYGSALAGPSGIITLSRIALTANAGGGVKVPVNQNWGIRTDARWFNGRGRDAGEHWRLYNGVTFRPSAR